MLQIFGTSKCKNTQKAQRFFKERGIQFHFIDLSQKAMSKGELESVARSVPLEHLIDTTCKEYERLNLKYIIHDITEQLLEHPLLFITPVVRCGKEAVVGFAQDTWLKFAQMEKK